MQYIIYMYKISTVYLLY